MIIWGSKGIASDVEDFWFFCPSCRVEREGVLKRVRNFFTLYFIPLFPTGEAGRYLQCTSCGGEFDEEVRNFDPANIEKERVTRLMRVMVLSALADGQLRDQEIDTIRRLYKDVAGLPLPQSTLTKEIDMARESGADLNSYVASFAPELSGHEMAQLVEVSYKTMASSGQLLPGHRDQIKRLADTLRIDEEQYVDLIEEIQSAPG